jgi:hypothetical protein
MSDFDREAAMAQIVAEHQLDARLARMAADPDPKTQAANIASLKAALAAGGADDKAKDEAIAKLRQEYQAAREARDVTKMVSIKHTLARDYGVFQV